MSAHLSLGTAAMAGLAVQRQPTPVFPQPKAPLSSIPALKCQFQAPSRLVPAVNVGGKWLGLSRRYRYNKLLVAAFSPLFQQCSGYITVFCCLSIGWG